MFAMSMIDQFVLGVLLFGGLAMYGAQKQIEKSQFLQDAGKHWLRKWLGM